MKRLGKTGAAGKIIYLDNAATTWPKPARVRSAMLNALSEFGANPGRGGHTMSLSASEAVFSAREKIADFFGCDDPSRVIFTQSCTMSLNIAIKGILKSGGRAIVSDLEHNAVMRPLAGLSGGSAVYDIAHAVPGDPDATVRNFERCIKSDTKAIICLHASNVFGTLLPIRRLGALARSWGLSFIVDAAQSAGVIPISTSLDNIDFLCMPGHKGLYGPMGTGILICAGGPLLPPFIEGGTGSRSLESLQPDELPDRLESGTLNITGICGAAAGIDFIKKRGRAGIAAHEYAMTGKAYDMLSGMRGVHLYGARPDIAVSAPLLAFNIDGMDSEDTAARLNDFGIAVRAGLHCAPSAHRVMGTLDSGIVRLAPSAFTTAEEISYFCRGVQRIAGR